MLPPLTLADALKTTRIHSVAELAGTRTAVVATHRFRSQRPSYTSSEVGLIGGGQVPMPSEMLRVHYGGLLSG